MKKFQPIGKNFPHMIHGGDYNPDQWLDMPEIINEDIRLIPIANCNAMSINIFSWATIEPEEGKYDFSFLDMIMDKLHSIGAKAVLATPSGARPAWMSQAHPEVLRVSETRVRNLHGDRHNHCYTSPYYRKKITELNTRLAERYKDHPALIMWHVSNEYGGECHCELCQKAFREWLKKRYKSIDDLNKAYWTRFWSHTFNDWEQIESPSSIGENCLNGLNIDWKRFVTHQTKNFYECEIEPLKRITPDIPVGINMMYLYNGLDYFKFKDVVDYVSWDNYPTWHDNKGDDTPATIAFNHDMFRSIKGKPFLLMENTPSQTSWQKYSKLKKPGMHLLASMQAVAHGSDSVQYFQWRKSRGAHEKFHGAVIDHCGHENTRVFRDVAQVGDYLKKLDDVVGTYTTSEVAIVFDSENRWGIDFVSAMSKNNRNYVETCINHYKPFWENAVNCDVIDSDCDFSKYKLVVAPMLYMIKPGVAEKIEKYVKDGGNIVFTYVSGWVDENDLCFLGGFPGGILKDVFGIWDEELDSLRPEDYNIVKSNDGKEYKAIDYCELIHANTANVLATYSMDFYKDMPALTCNSYGKGKAYYIAFRDTGDFLTDLYKKIINELDIKKNLVNTPYNVTAHTREDEHSIYMFIENYCDSSREITLDTEYEDMINGGKVSGTAKLPQYGIMILKKSK